MVSMAGIEVIHDLDFSDAPRDPVQPPRPCPGNARSKTKRELLAPLVQRPISSFCYGPTCTRECSQKSPKCKDLSVPSVTQILNTESTEFSVTSVVEAFVTEITEFLRAGTGQ